MFCSSHMIVLVFNDLLLVLLKKASDRYATSECRSKCCNWNWNVRNIRGRTKTYDTLESES